jgi:hypothetical protein
MQTTTAVPYERHRRVRLCSHHDPTRGGATHLVLLDRFHRDDVNFVVGRERRVDTGSEKLGTGDGSDTLVLVFRLEETLVREVASGTFGDEVENLGIGTLGRGRRVETVG